MWTVQTNNDGLAANGFAELNNDTQVELKEVRNGVTCQAQGLSEEDESQINDSEDVNDGHMEVGQVKTHDRVVKQVLQQQSQGPSVNWERFLPFRSLKVLLVENDDSTRHVVSALLRNCGYEVTAVADGLQAWKLLQDLTNHVDLVISEVVMPCLSGIGLLSKIMNHKTCKNIPVIMMSCHDSMNVVFKCLSKGAVDFLVKPIRKNELKNLWQHVWRRCHSSSGSGSGSESGVRTQKSTKSKSDEDSDNQSGSNDEDDIGSIGLNARNGSDNGSGTQSCWTERAVEVESPKPMSPWDDIAEHPDSTCAKVIHSWPEEFGTNWVPTTATKGCEGQEDEFENIVMGKDLGIGGPRILNMQLEGKSKMISIAVNNGEKFSERNSKKDDEQLDKGNLELNSEKPNEESRNQVADVMGTNNTDPQVESAIIDKSNNTYKVPNTKNKYVHENKELPSLGLSLKRNRDVGDTETAHDRSILRHSAFSAFSRYNSASTTNQALTGNVGSCSPLDNSSEAAKTESMQNLRSNSNTTPPNQRSNGSSNNNDMGSTTNNAFSKPSVPDNKLAPKSTVKKMHAAECSSAFQSARNEHVPLPPTKTAAMNANSTSDSMKANPTSEQPGCSNQQVQVQHHYHHYHHHHHHVHNIPKQQQLTHREELTLKKMAAAAPHCGSSNMQSAQKLPDYSLNGNGSGSDQGSNGQNGSSRAINTKGTDIDNNDRVAGKGGINIGIGFGSRIGFDQNRVTQREAALNKFRQKRKERCFEKKVRYHSRKKLAEQRPRIRGQFVRQVLENKEKDADS